MKRIVIFRNEDIETIDAYTLEKCLRIMFPECEIEIQSSKKNRQSVEESGTIRKKAD